MSSFAPPPTTEAPAPDPAATPPQGLPDPAPPATDAAPATNGVTDPVIPQGDLGETPGQTPPGTDTPPPPAWAEAADVDAVLAVESVAERVTAMREEHKAEHIEEGRKTAQSQLQPILQGNQKRLGEIQAGVQTFVRTWNKAVKAGDFTQAEATDLIEEHRSTFETLAQVQMDAGRWEGRGEWINLAGKLDSGIPSEFGPRFQALQQGLDDPTFTDDFLKAVGKAVADPIRAELTEAKANIARLEGEARDAGRISQPAPVKTGGLGGGANIDNSDPQKRLDRLSVGKDSDGNLPTDADRTWLAAQGN